MPSSEVPGADPSFGEAARFWFRLGFVNVGGPAGQIATLHQELVVRRRWVDEDRFRHALGFCTMLPGPEAQQLAIYVGWMLHRVPGGLAAGIGFILPAAFLLTGLAWLTVARGGSAIVAGGLWGLRAVVVGIVAMAAARAGSRLLRDPWSLGTALAAFVIPPLFGVPFTLAVAVAAAIGALRGTTEVAEGDAPLQMEETKNPLRTLLLGLAIWWLPLVALTSLVAVPVLATAAGFFGTTAALTFGGAYAVLATVNQAAVSRFGWLSSSEVVVGLGLAESTPGPLLMVTTFIGYVAAYRAPGDLSPAIAGILGATVATWATFSPSFLWVFLGAPYVERLRGDRRLAGAFTSVSAAVAGILANLAAWFAVQVLFTEVDSVAIGSGVIPLPQLSSFDVIAASFAAVALVLIRRGVGVLPLIVGGTLVGALLRLG